jgi:uncharacterized Zn finger protein
MAKKKTQLDQFADLTWNDLEEWAGSKIVSRGKNYQCQGHVSDLAVTDDDGLPDSICTCPYELDCKHGVAVVIEYLKRIEEGQPIPKANQGDDRLEILEDEDCCDEPIDEETVVSEDVRKEISQFLKGKTKAQLIELIGELTQQYPEMAQDLMDQRLGHPCPGASRSKGRDHPPVRDWGQNDG